MAFLRKEKCFRSAPINEGSDSTYRVAAAFTQFAGGSTKYFGTYHAEFPKPERSSLRIELCLWINAIYPLLQCQSSSSSLVRASDWHSEDPGSNPGWISMSFFAVTNRSYSEITILVQLKQHYVANKVLQNHAMNFWTQ